MLALVLGVLLVIQDRGGADAIESLGPWFLLGIAALPVALVVLVLWLLRR